MNPGIEKLFEHLDRERLTPEEVGEVIGQSPGTIRRRLREGDLPGYRNGTGTKAPWFLVKCEVIDALRSGWNQDQTFDTSVTTVPAGADSKE